MLSILINGVNIFDAPDFIGTLVIIASILQFLSGTIVCKQYVTNQTTAEASPLPFLCCILSCTLWFLYGLCIHDDKIVFVNTVGVVLMVVYTKVFYVFTMKKAATLKQIMITLTLITIAILYTTYQDDDSVLLNRLGLSACCVTILTVAAPLSKLAHVIRMKSTECLPFPIILMSFFVSLLWFRYGMITQDWFLITPNLIGVCLAVFQLLLFVKYPSRQQLQKITLA